MKIAIHHTPGTFSDRWIAYCQEKGIDYKVVNAYDTDIISQVADCDAFMWHHHHANPKDVLFAKQLLYSLEEAGKRVFPDWRTCWHFDDKVGQKYLLEAAGAPLVPSYVFYTKQEALAWIEQTTFPKVFKLRGGAGAANVKLAHTAKEARGLVRKAFGCGFPQFDRWGYLKERYNKWRQGKDTLLGVCKGIGRLVIPTDYARMHAPEKGYAYFQDFIENNYYDIRVIAIGDKAFAIKRMVRKDDFRASGSGNIHYAKEELNEDCVRRTFELARKLQSQCLAVDFVFKEERPLIVEISYGFAVPAYDHCPGYWTNDMQWHEGSFNPQAWMVDSIVQNGGGNLDMAKYIEISGKFDLRIVVIGDRLLAEKRYARPGDFRASGSGQFEYSSVPDDVIETAFQTAERLHLQSVAFDFIFDHNSPLIVEMSYAFGYKGLSHCPGYYSRNHEYHPTTDNDFCGWMVENLIR